MDSQFISSISIEKFAAYLDDNLPENEMQEIEAAISQNESLEELVEMSDMIDEDVQTYLQDDFTYDADMSMLDESDFEIPQFDEISEEYPLVASAADGSDENIDDKLDIPADTVPTDIDQLTDIHDDLDDFPDIDDLNHDQEHLPNGDSIFHDENNVDLQDMNLFSPNE